MDSLILFVQSHVEYAHYIIFFSLLMAGFNIPVSEDAMLFVAAILAAKYPIYLPQLFIAVYMGAYLSDLICYWLGRSLGPKIFEMRLLSKMAPPQRVEKIHQYYKSYGMRTLLVGRFIPFGVRNGLFLTAGLGKMNFIRFALIDLLACTISTVSFFSIYYTFGYSIIETIKNANILLFAAVVSVLLVYVFTKKLKKKAPVDLNKKPNQNSI